MLQNAENIALQSSQILYTFVLRAEIPTTFLRKYTKFANFARLYLPLQHFATKLAVCKFFSLCSFKISL